MRTPETTSRLSLPALVVILLVRASTVCAGEASVNSAQDLPLDSQGVPMLKDIYAKDFLIGAATDFRGFGFSPRELEIIKSQYNVLTPENSMKPAFIHPEEDRWDWRAADTLVEFCEANHIQVVGHTLVWHNSTGIWFFRGEDGAPVSREQALARLKQHIQTVVGHYKGRVKGWDVVNEAIADSGSGTTENLRSTSWLRAIGPDYITYAFKYAHEADPNAELYYNDYNIERGAKHQSSLLLLNRLLKEGAPITAVGIQGHWSLSNLPYKELDKAINDYKALGLKVNITELDITVTGRGGGQLGPPGGLPGTAPTSRPATTATTGTAAAAPAAMEPGFRFGGGRGFGRPFVPPTPQQLQTQATAYEILFRIFLDHKDVITRVTFWGLSDRRSWRGGQSPLLFDRDNNPKPALHAIAEAKTRRASLTSWAADNGNGTYSNPLFYEEFEDPDVIRVGEDYYLAGTTMHMNPGLIVLHSKDLVNWELASYCIARLDFGPAFRLEGRGVYGQGIWAPCIRYHDGTFYVLSNVNGVGCQVFRSKSPEGPWARNQLPGMHDVSVLFDDDGKIYAIYGAGRPTIVELNKDLTEIIPNTRRQMNAQGMGEGHHLYKIKGKYFDVSAIPGAHTDQVAARADSIAGPWQVERMVQGESLGVPTQNGLRAGGRGGNRTFTITPSDPNAGGGLTLHQGGIVDTPSGEWWSIIMQDHGSIGRMVALVPVTWDNDFPIIGLPGNLRKAPNTWVKSNTGHAQDPKPPFVRSDNFDAPKLNPVWQWNHVPDDTKWSLTEKPGVLRLHSLPAGDFWMARNSLTQRPPGPESVATVELDASGLVAGDSAGLALLSSPYAWIGVVKSAEGVTLQTFDQTNRTTATAPTSPTHLWLRAACNFDTEKAVFSWSADGKDFAPLGEPFTMVFQLTTFQGVRFALFNYSKSGKPGGHADFDNFTVDEPRASGIERTIPVGKTITLTSGADGSFLAADTQNNALVNVRMHVVPTSVGVVTDANAAVPQNTKFLVVDLGKGRVALKAANDRFVSASGDNVSLKDLAGNTPGDAESFQWINLMRGDTMLMSLTNHRYLATKPNDSGPVTVSATGPRPDRKDGACFKWKALE